MKWLMAYSCALLITGVPTVIAAEPSSDPAVEKELKSLQGLWQVIYLAKDGRQAPADVMKPMRWRIGKDKITFIDPNVPEDASEAAFTIDPSKSPKAIDIAEAGADNSRMIEGIYELKNGSLKVCLRDQLAKDRDRPEEFEGAAGVGLIVFKRVEESDDPSDLIVGEWRDRKEPHDAIISFLKDGTGSITDTTPEQTVQTNITWKATRTYGNACVVEVEYVAPKPEGAEELPEGAKPFTWLVVFDGKDTFITQPRQNDIVFMDRQKSSPRARGKEGP